MRTEGRRVPNLARSYGSLWGIGADLNLTGPDRFNLVTRHISQVASELKRIEKVERIFWTMPMVLFSWKTALSYLSSVNTQLEARKRVCNPYATKNQNSRWNVIGVLNGLAPELAWLHTLDWTSNPGLSVWIAPVWLRLDSERTFSRILPANQVPSFRPNRKMPYRLEAIRRECGKIIREHMTFPCLYEIRSLVCKDAFRSGVTYACNT